jgi:phosphatidylserine/phosphatidylglycerophosphate/cardiolipin synthase-like enzyme
MDKKRLGLIQKRLAEDIKKGTRKRDFSPFDIYQFIEADKKEAFLEEQDIEAKTVSQDVVGLLLSAHEQVLIFSGNFTWSNLIQKEHRILDILEDLANKGVKIRILSGIHLPAVENIGKVLEINRRIKNPKNRVEVRHAFQPLRAIIVDDKIARIKEIKNPSDYEESKRTKTFIFYSIYDKVWIKWLQKVFWDYFDSGDYAEARMKELRSIQKIAREK